MKHFYQNCFYKNKLVKHKNFIALCWDQHIIPSEYVVNHPYYQYGTAEIVNMCMILNLLYIPKRNNGDDCIHHMHTWGIEIDIINDYIDNIITPKVEKQRLEESIKVNTKESKRVKI